MGERRQWGNRRIPREGTWVVLAALAVVALRLVIGLQADHPHLFPDEIGYLAEARALGGAHPAFSLGAVPFYFPLYSLLLAPIFALHPSPAVAFHEVMVVNAALGGATLVLLYVTARRVLTADHGPALWGSLLACAYSGQVLLTQTAWADDLLPLGVLAWILAVHAYLRRRSLRSEALVLASAIGCYVIHPRGVLLIAVTLVVVAMAGWIRRSDPRHQLAMSAALVVGYLATNRLVTARLEPLYASGGRQLQDGFAVGRLGHPSHWGDIATRLVGGVWYQVVATSGLLAIGVAAIVATTIAAMRARRAGGGRRGRVGPDADLSAFTGASVLVAVGALLAGSAAFATGPRADTYFYGRYVDAITPLLAVAGVAAIWGAAPSRRWRLGAVAGASIVVTSGLFALVAPHLDRVSLVTDMVLGLAGHISAVGLHVLPIAAVALAVVLVAGLVAWRAPAVACAALVVGAAVAGIAGRSAVLAEPFRNARTLDDLAATTAELTHGSAVGIDLDASRQPALGGYQWFRPDLHGYPVTSEDDVHSPWLLGRLRWAVPLHLGADLVATDPSRDIGLYVLPGADQNRLRATGAILPIDFPAVIPPDDARARITGLPVTLTVAGTRTIRLRVEHLGAGQRWPRFDPDGAGFSQAHVRIGARLVPIGARAAHPVATYFADLPTDLLPGQSASVELTIGGRPATGHAPPPGRYRLLVDLDQVGVGWFADLAGTNPISADLTIRG